MSSEEWFALPWWEAEILTQGLIKEFGTSDEKSAGTSGPRPAAAAPPKRDPEKTPSLASADLGAIANNYGVQVRRAG